MPRADNIYAIPPGTEGVPDETIASTPYNSFVHDVEFDLNAARPVVAGGTGATSATQARANLQAERASHRVTNYGGHVWEIGSFYSTNDVPDPPVTGHAFAGIVYGVIDTTTPANTKLVIEARDLDDTDTPGAMWVREKIGTGAWSAWSQDLTAGGIVIEEGDVVLEDGDINVESGNITVSNANPILVLDKEASGEASQIAGSMDGKARWSIMLGDDEPETGSNAGSDFQIKRADDAGVLIDSPISIDRATGMVDVQDDLTVGGDLAVVGGIAAVGSIASTANIRAESIDPILSLLRNGVSGTMSVRGSQQSGGAGAGQRWQLDLGNGDLESGSNAGSNFALNRFADNSAFLGVPLNINRASGAATFSVTGSTAPTGYAMNIGCGSSYAIGIRPALDNLAAVTLLNAAATQVGNIFCTPAATQFNTTSDARLKEDLRSFDVAASAIIEATNVYDFKWKSTGERTYGVVAQEAEAIFPAAVTYDEKNDWWGIDYSKYVPVILQELKALRARVAELEERLEAKPS